MKKISVYCGETIKGGEQLHPVLDVEKAIAIIESLNDETCYSNSPDFVMAIKWIGEKRGVETEFFLNGVSQGNSIEEIFEDFNRALDMINNLSE